MHFQVQHFCFVDFSIRASISAYLVIDFHIKFSQKKNMKFDSKNITQQKMSI